MVEGVRLPRTFAGCCARASVMNSRRLTAFPQGQASGIKYSRSGPCIVAKAAIHDRGGGRGRRPLYGTRLVDVPRHDRRAEQVTGAQSDSPDGSVGVEEPKGYARIVSPSMVKCEATIDVSFDPKYDVLPRHVFQTHTNGPAIAPIDEIRELPTHGVHCTGAYLHTSPA